MTNGMTREESRNDFEEYRKKFEGTAMFFFYYIERNSSGDYANSHTDSLWLGYCIRIKEEREKNEKRNQ
jgi:hypothetical protein